MTSKRDPEQGERRERVDRVTTILERLRDEAEVGKPSRCAIGRIRLDAERTLGGHVYVRAHIPDAPSSMWGTKLTPGWVARVCLEHLPELQPA